MFLYSSGGDKRRKKNKKHKGKGIRQCIGQGQSIRGLYGHTDKLIIP